ncbi:gp25 domain protein [Mycobacteroides abscessus subsp. bolletii 1513]|uniref:Gp25 domain protein n=1 Tax=Mycobacteroides abscessus subsp. bolletii 1513 TaxID=1299321 RepID=X8DHU8_9MYCO|nr:gp25 domain protein [Mycobacteroides abscessus subsp. bolletii 1513]
MTAPADPVQAQLGDRVYLGTRLANVHFYGDVSDIDTPGATTATMEMVGDDAVVTMDALVGPKAMTARWRPLSACNTAHPSTACKSLKSWPTP